MYSANKGMAEKAGFMKWLSIEHSADPLTAIGNLGPYPNVDDDVDRDDGWF